ncbi:MAG: hypothetical protein ACF8QF_08820 [Phycisphaerales bacterium]
MPCLIALLALMAPRITIVLLVILSDYIGNAYSTILWPLLGFLFFPFTTLAYAFAINEAGSVAGFHLVLVVIAVLFDLGAMGGGGQTVVVTRRGRPAA